MDHYDEMTGADFYNQMNSDLEEDYEEEDNDEDYFPSRLPLTR
jgi:hypothetical protein